MMMYGQALRQLEFLETVDDRNGKLNEMVEAKFRYVPSHGCACVPNYRIPARKG